MAASGSPEPMSGSVASGAVISPVALRGERRVVSAASITGKPSIEQTGTPLPTSSPPVVQPARSTMGARRARITAPRSSRRGIVVTEDQQGAAVRRWGPRRRPSRAHLWGSRRAVGRWVIRWRRGGPLRSTGSQSPRRRSCASLSTSPSCCARCTRASSRRRSSDEPRRFGVRGRRPR